ncbi:hypothetical protein OG21DRAFT_1466374 [Imleria badia]|nr:hypothetical protein OG21DRAFT_1466374 [Imleria badia]
MKRGFLNTDKAKRKLSADTNAPNDHSLGKDKGKAKAETPADVVKPCPPLLDLHSIPPSMKSVVQYPKGRNRFIFRHWPRDPNGKPIVPSDIHGKEAGNDLNLWGATLYDFYFVRRIPSSEHGLTISTGSKLTKVMEAFGELEHAQSEIAWASREADPKEIPAWDPAQAIVAYERRVHVGSGVVNKVNKKKSTPPQVSGVVPEPYSAQMLDTTLKPKEDTVRADMDPALEESVNEPSGKPADSMDVDEVCMQQPPSDMPVESPFHPSHYPSPWPLVPFESPYSPFALRRGIPVHLLPKKLYVHDPWDLVRTETPPDGEEKSWTSKTDHVRTYTLSLQRKMAEAASKAAAAEEEALKIPETVFIPPQEIEGPTEQPAIRAFLPKRPGKPTEVPEAHLYLSPKGKLGTGNHSIVYEAELELPRDLFCESTYCKSCLDEQIEAEVDRLKESGEWEERMNEAAKSYDGPQKHDATSRHSPSSSSVQIAPRYVGFVQVKIEHVPMETADMVAATTLGETPAADAPSQFARVSDSVINRYVEYQGLVIPIHPNIQWQNPSFPDTICAHQAKRQKPVPRTAMFRVAAKLSLPNDYHLVAEAENYHKFPAHFFQHWTGYNVIPPLHDPTPVGALVPQFFGYYAPGPSSNSDGGSAYCSSILLIEHCGKPIIINKLSTDDRHECAALLFRFHAAGWLHESFSQRNILMQKQHPTCSPLEDEDQCEFPHKHRRYSFRLIDFGRSVEYENASQRCVEESTGKSLFGIL